MTPCRRAWEHGHDGIFPLPRSVEDGPGVAAEAPRSAVSLWAFVGTAIALGVERACYVWIARAPGVFRRWCASPRLARLGEPLVILRKLFYGFKLFQLSVSAGWCYVWGNGSLVPAARGTIALGLGGALILVGQGLNWSVFYRLGAVGVFYGDRLGHEVRWSRGFPFSVLSHPQYVGTVLSIWGLFLTMRFPHDDWSFVPAVETVYYVVGAWLEGRHPARESRTSRDCDSCRWPDVGGGDQFLTANGTSLDSPPTCRSRSTRGAVSARRATRTDRAAAPASGTSPASPRSPARSPTGR